MLEHLFLEESAVFFEHFDDDLVCVFDKHINQVSGFGDKSASFVDHLDEGQIVLLAHSAVVFTKCRCDMDDACAVCQGDVIIVGDVVRLLLCTSFVVEERLVLFVFIVLALFQ